ncbi:MAG: hypothetical protein ACLPN1_07590 [Dissulfurispiraceae bacterium]
MKLIIASIITVLLALVTLPPSARAVSYDFQTVDDPSAIIAQGYEGTAPQSINDNGVVAGYYLGTYDGTYPAGHNGFMRAVNGTFTNGYDTYSGCNGMGFTYAYGINNNLQISGYCLGSALGFHYGFILNATTEVFTTIDNPNASLSIADDGTTVTGINDNGLVTGYYTDVNHAAHGFIRSADGLTYTTIDYPSASETNAYGINNNGQATGTCVYGAGDHGFIRSADGTQYTAFDVTNAPLGETNAQGINDIGQIAGWYFGNDSHYHGFVRCPDGSQLTIDYPSATITEAFGINNNGQVTGLYTDSLGEHGFIATPIVVPLPVRVIGPPDAYFQSFTQAYESLTSGSVVTIETQVATLDGPINLDNALNLTLLGGLDSYFACPTGMTTILGGALIVGSDSLTVSNIAIQ